jgi:hypothetical protein
LYWQYIFLYAACIRSPAVAAAAAAIHVKFPVSVPVKINLILKAEPAGTDKRYQSPNTRLVPFPPPLNSY